jgi:hypothetical protein
MEKMRKLSLRDRKFLQAYLETGNRTEAAKRAGFKCSTNASFGEMGSRALKRVEGNMPEIMAEIGLDDVKLAEKALEGLEAMVVKPFAHKGVVISEPSYIDYATRAKYLEIIARMKGLLKDRVDHVASGTITIRVKGRDYSKIEHKPIEIKVTDAEMLEIPEKVER